MLAHFVVNKMHEQVRKDLRSVSECGDKLSVRRSGLGGLFN